MKVFKKFWVSVLVTVLVIGCCLGYGQATRAADLVEVTFNSWIQDSAGVLSADTISTLKSYNTKWDNAYTSVLAVATVDSTTGWDISDYTLELADNWGLGSWDMILVLDIGGQQCYMDCGDDIYEYMDSNQINDYINSYLYSDMMSGAYDAGLLSFFEAWDSWYTQMGSGSGSGVSSGSGSSYYNNYYSNDYGYGYGYSSGGLFGGAMMIGLIFLLAVLLIVLSIIDSIRMAAYRARYYGMTVMPPFRPLLFWHRPGGVWYNRYWHGPHGPGGMGGPRGPGGMGGFGGGHGGGGGRR